MYLAGNALALIIVNFKSKNWKVSRNLYVRKKLQILQQQCYMHMRAYGMVLTKQAHD